LLTAIALWRYLEILGIGPDLFADSDSGAPLPEGRSLYYRFDEGGFSARNTGGEQAVLGPRGNQLPAQSGPAQSPGKRRGAPARRG
jgi:recombinational DNA repair protein (RecF pathway)